ncbi:MAG: thioredoxin family protein [bacterium]
MKILKFGAVWCNSCLVMRLRWRDIEMEKPWLITEYYDYDKDKVAVKKYEIEGEKLPIFIFLDKVGTEIMRLHGEPSKEELLELILKYKDK